MRDFYDALLTEEGDDFALLPETERQALVAEAFHTFGEATARGLAVMISVRFFDCAEAIERGRYRLN